MAITMEEVRSHLDPDEPNYPKAAGMGPEALPYLLILVRGDDPMLAAKAAYLAGLIDDDLSSEVLYAAAESPVPEVQVAAAAAVRHLRRTPSNEILNKLKTNTDAGVQKLLKRYRD